MRAVQILSLLLLLASVALSQEVICGKVVSVSDGDTITVLTPEKTQIRVRIAFVDCPESHQPFGARAKQAMSALVFGKEVELGTQGKDRYGRVLALVYLDGTDVGLEMIKIVLAWPY